MIDPQTLTKTVRVLVEVPVEEDVDPEAVREGIADMVSGYYPTRDTEPTVSLLDDTTLVAVSSGDPNFASYLVECFPETVKVIRE